MDYSSGLKRIKSFKELLEDEEFDIDEYVSVYEKEQFRLKNTIYLINTGDESYDFSLDGEKEIEKQYVIVNLNKNAEKFFDELVDDIKTYSKKGYCIYYVPVAKGNNIYYQDLQ